MRRLALALLVVVAWLPLARAQYTPPPPPLTTGPCKPTKDYPCTPLPAATAPPATTQFPFPGDAPATDTNKLAPSRQFPFPGEPPANSTPAPTPSDAQSPAQKFPFPGEPPVDSVPAPTPGQPSPAQKFPFPDDASASSSSSSSDSSDVDPAADPAKPIADAGSYGSTRASRRRKLAVPEDMDEREAKDIEVSRFYADTGNFQGSYLRAQDAVKTIPDDPLAHFTLAESARNLKKTDEAIVEYKLYLKLDPEGEKVKAAKRALADLGAK